MNGPQFIYAVRWLVRDTFRQAMASRVFWIMLGVSLLCIVFCLGVSVDGGLGPRRPDDTELYTRDNKPFTGDNNPYPARLTLLFGLMRFEVPRDRETGVHLLQVILASWVAGSAGLLLALVWTAGFVPEFLQPGAAAVLFAKPVPRWALLLGRYLGVVAFVAVQVAIFFFGTWVALGVRTDVWAYSYLAGIPVMVLSFAALYSFSVLLAVCTRSTVACLFGSVLFWLVCWGINVGRHYTVALPVMVPAAEGLSPLTRFLSEVGYWSLPKPADMVVVLEQTIHAGQHFAAASSWDVFRVVDRMGAFEPAQAVLSSLGFAAVTLFLAARQLGKTEY
jgi:ABC-type transport system involved in multi-copper enzyme maturation permease subunit